VGAGPRAGDRVGAFEARRGRTARARDRGDPRACWCDQVPASRSASVEKDPVSGSCRTSAGEVVQVDLVGPRHLDGGVRFHALNQIDVASHHAGIEIVQDRSDRTVLVALHALWGRHGVPGRIQFDNGSPFVSPTGLGEVVRVCLRQGSTLVFVPPREPWRNGAIEHFNETFDKRFFRQERFADVEQLTERAGAFERFHNVQHRDSATRGLAPEQTTTARAPRSPRALTELPAELAGGGFVPGKRRGRRGCDRERGEAVARVGADELTSIVG
jgi:integrase-like protein